MVFVLEYLLDNSDGFYFFSDWQIPQKNLKHFQHFQHLMHKIVGSLLKELDVGKKDLTSDRVKKKHRQQVLTVSYKED